MQLQVFKDSPELSAAAAEVFVQAAQQAMLNKGSFTVALTGGSSPASLYQLLATPAYSDRVDWAHVYIFWGDERWVPMESSQSNAKMAFDLLLSKVDIPSGHIHPMYDAAQQPEEFADTYAQWIKDQANPDGVFDLILLGMGDDGHTASLFPGTDVVHEQGKWVAAYYLEAQKMHRITLTAPILNKAKQVLVMTFGDKKANALHQVLEGDYNPDVYPSQLLDKSKDSLLFFVDEQAAALLTKR
jgi:6-phosphogluconolactonase